MPRIRSQRGRLKSQSAVTTPNDSSAANVVAGTTRPHPKNGLPDGRADRDAVTSRDHKAARSRTSPTTKIINRIARQRDGACISNSGVAGPEGGRFIIGHSTPSRAHALRGTRVWDAPASSRSANAAESVWIAISRRYRRCLAKNSTISLSGLAPSSRWRTVHSILSASIFSLSRSPKLM